MPVAVILTEHDADILETILKHHMDGQEKAIRDLPFPHVGREMLTEGMRETASIRFALQDARR